MGEEPQKRQSFYGVSNFRRWKELQIFVLACPNRKPILGFVSGKISLAWENDNISRTNPTWRWYGCKEQLGPLPYSRQGSDS
jgi:hypothetical protein